MPRKSKYLELGWFLTSDKLRSISRLSTFRFSIISAVLAACGREITPSEPIPDDTQDTLSDTTALTPILAAGVDYISTGNNREIITSNYETIKTIGKIEDINTTDGDQLIISTNEDITKTPQINGFENVFFTVGSNFTPADQTLNIDLKDLSNFDYITVDNSFISGAIEKVTLNNAYGNINFGDKITDINISAIIGTNISLGTTENAIINLSNSAKDLTVDGGGRSLNITTSNVGDINILENSAVILAAPNSQDNLTISSNGSVSVSDVGSLTGNINISSVGDITVNNADSLAGKLELDNIRAIPGDDIIILQASKAKSVDIKSTGAVIANINGGFKSAETISVQSAEDSTIYAIENVPRIVSLTANNNTGNEIIFTIDINSMSTLSLNGTVPLLVMADGEDLDQTTVTTNNSSTSAISITGANTDLSNIVSTVQIRLQNFDGKTIVTGQNQNLAIDAEIPQTSGNGRPIINFETDATSSTSNTISMRIIDTNTLNKDTTAKLAGFKTSDIQIVNIDLTDGIDLITSGNISGSDLQTINLTGSGNFELANSTIVGGLGTPVSLTTQSYTGKLTASIDNTSTGLKSISSGSGDDLIEINGATTLSPGISINSGAGNDTLSLTANSDGNSVLLSLDGGLGVDKASFSAGLDFSLSNFTLTNIEQLEFTGGSDPVKLPSSVVSTKNYEISEKGAGTLSLEIFPTAQVINLSSLSLDSSIVSGTDTITINGLNFSQALTITGTNIGDTITGTHTSADNISSGDGNDTINGSDGNDTLTPGNGADHVTSGMGTDTINLTEVVGAVDTLNYSIDDGAANVDAVTGFDVRVANDIISLDVSETSTAITFGNGNAATATSLGNIAIIKHNVDTDLDHSSNSAASIIKLTAIDQPDFEKAIGRGEITTADGSAINFLWFDDDTNQAVFGYSIESTASDADNKIKGEDGFVEIARLAMTESNYTHYLDTNNFIFI